MGLGGARAYHGGFDAIHPCARRAHAQSEEPDLDLPRERLIVITGLSGSGKSSLAFDTLYAEGQRRYVESLSAYARQFLPAWTSPTSTASRASRRRSPSSRRRARTTRARPSAPSPRSTTTCACCTRAPASRAARSTASSSPRRRWPDGRPGARAARGHAPRCARAVVTTARASTELFEDLRAQGFVRVRIDGAIHEIDALPELEQEEAHHRGGGRSPARARRRRAAPGRIVRDRAAPRRAACATRGLDGPGGEEQVFSSRHACPCAATAFRARAEAFSFNSPSAPARAATASACRRSSTRARRRCIRTCRSPAARCAAGTGATSYDF